VCTGATVPAATGLLDGRYVRDVRTAAAAHLLLSTALPLPEVAARCGFGSSETLRSAFLQRYGIAPSRYRAVHNGPSGGRDRPPK
jgi:transcriptional regulator GlxA family with amidase domain